MGGGNISDRRNHPRGLTGLQDAVAGLSTEPGLAVLRVVGLGDEGEVTGDLPVVGDHKALPLELPELDILKFKLTRDNGREEQENKRAWKRRNLVRDHPRDIPRHTDTGFREIRRRKNE